MTVLIKCLRDPIQTLECVQRRAAIYAFNNYTDMAPGSVTCMLQQLKWLNLKQHTLDANCIQHASVRNTVGSVNCDRLVFNFFLTRLPSQTTSSRWQADKEAIGLSRVQQFSHLCVARPYQISVNSIFKHIHTTSINTIIWQFVPFIYHPL